MIFEIFYHLNQWFMTLNVIGSLLILINKLFKKNRSNLLNLCVSLLDTFNFNLCSCPKIKLGGGLL